MLQTELLEYPAIGHPVLDELYGPFVAQIIEKSANVRIEHPVHFLPQYANIQRVQRLMRTALIIVHGALRNQQSKRKTCTASDGVEIVDSAAGWGERALVSNHLAIKGGPLHQENCWCESFFVVLGSECTLFCRLEFM